MPKARLFQIVWHAREGVANEPIMSIDMHPLHPLLATAGSDHFVRVWRVRETAATEAEAGSGGGGSISAAAPAAAPAAATVEFLFTMSLHGKTVNAVRWSPNGAQAQRARRPEGGRALGSADGNYYFFPSGHSFVRLNVL